MGYRRLERRSWWRSGGRALLAFARTTCEPVSVVFGSSSSHADGFSRRSLKRENPSARSIQILIASCVRFEFRGPKRLTNDSSGPSAESCSVMASDSSVFAGRARRSAYSSEVRDVSTNAGILDAGPGAIGCAVAGAGARRVRRVALVAESLEDRQLLSILVTSHGGTPPVLANVQITSVYYGWNAADLKTLQTKLDDYLSDVSGSSYLGNLLEYGVGTGTLGPKDDVVAAPAGGFSVKTTIAATVPFAGGASTIPTNVTLNNFVADRNGNGITDPNNIESTLNTEIKNGDLPAPVAGTSLYWVWLPPGVNVLFPDASGGPSTAMSNATFGGYHFFTNVGNPQGQYAYVVMPFPSAASTPATVTAIKTWFAGLKANQVAPAFPTTYTAKSADAFNMLTAVGGHEMGEAVTDPYATGWYYTPMGTGGEIGDLLNGQNVWFTPAQAAATGNSYLVQLLWSNFIAQSNYPHAEPLVGGNPGLPGVVSSPNAVASRPPVQFAPNPPTSPPTRPKQPAPPSLPGPVPPPISNPVIPGGGSVIQPVIVSSLYNPSDVALASQNGLQVSTNDGASWSTSIAFPASASSSGDSALDV